MRAMAMTAGGPWRRSGKLPIKLILLVLVVGGGAFAAIQVMKKAPAAEEEASGEKVGSEEEEKLGPAETVDLGEFLVNISDSGGGMRYVKTEISLIVQFIEHEEDEDGGGGGHGSGGSKDDEMQLPSDEHRLAQDAVIAVLASQKFEKLQADDGREQLKSALLTKLDERLEHYKVSEVLFTSFVMQ